MTEFPRDPYDRCAYCDAPATRRIEPLDPSVPLRVPSCEACEQRVERIRR